MIPLQATFADAARTRGILGHRGQRVTHLLPRRALVPNECRRLWNGIVFPVSDLGTTTPARLYRRWMALSIVR